MADYTGAYSGRTQYYIRLRVTGNAPAVSWSLTAIKGPGTSTGSWHLDCATWNVGIFGYPYSGCRGLDFRGGVTEILIASGSTPASGTAYVGANHLNVGLFGSAYAEGNYTAATTPPAPNINAHSPNPDNITQTGMRVRFSSTGDGGSPITSWQLQRATDAAFTQNVQTVTSSGTTVYTDMAPGTRYYFRARGVNALGGGAWSATISGQTLPAVAPGMAVTPSASGQSATVALTPPGGISGVTSYTVEYRPVGGASTSVTGATPITVNGLTPGQTYEWRALANFGSAASPWTAWESIFQPNPNTNPGDYFDGATTDTDDLDFRWSGTANNSASAAYGEHATGWADFDQASEDSGGTGAQYRVTGTLAKYPEGEPAGAFSARFAFFGDATAAGFRAGTDPSLGGAAVSEGGTYWASIYAQPSRAQRLAAGVSWYDASGNLVHRTVGTAQVVAAGAPVRLAVSDICPEDGFATVEAVDVTGTGWSLWLGGETITVDGAMVTVGAQYPYFDGNAPDTSQYEYAWLGDPDESESTRTTLAQEAADPLADPDCPAPPTPPRPPQIEDECVDTVGVWRRYWVQVPSSEVTTWLATIPTLYLTTGAQAARQVRIRFYENPDDTPASAFQTTEAPVSEQTVRYMPPNTVLTLDGVSQRARARVAGGPVIPADHLLTGAGGGPATWPVLACDMGYLIALDVPLDAALGNLTADLSLTRRML